MAPCPHFGGAVFTEIAMPVEFVGFLHYNESSESLAPHGAVVQPEFIKAFARAQEEGGFDKALIAYHSSAGDGFLVAQYAAAFTERLGLLVAHRPGFVAPTVAARKFATLDHLSGGARLGQYHLGRQRCRTTARRRLPRPRRAV
ncbi:alkanesulfonate monooxygenase [Novosphingobium nitrogenifigens DSM 19370]|uniref:Alkanesulfonate monooxygenase n=1 Tax=Novosphingobium nitrogenifigens DSM 19370 TaxID=983920 RepID=F1ZB33_9SPHN|nr:alkanesulfonate monooxygenase [Novosphingobium nitrogenifigens DSM 19370]